MPALFLFEIARSFTGTQVHLLLLRGATSQDTVDMPRIRRTPGKRLKLKKLKELSIYLSIYLSAHPSIYLSIYCIYLPIYLPIYLSIYLSSYLSICLI